MNVALVTCRTLPEPDVDERLLLDTLRADGVNAVVRAWDDQRVDWGNFDAAVLRSTWNYYEDRQAFLDWCDRCARSTRLINAPRVVRWNTHKRYLLELADAGVPVVDTTLLARGDTTTLATAVSDRGWQRVIVKPAVSAGSWNTWLVEAPARDEDEHRFGRLLAERDMLVQPYMPDVDAAGERCLVWIGGEITHAVRKTRRLAGDEESVSRQPVQIAAEEAELAREALDAARAAIAPSDGDMLYARIDMCRGEAGQPVLMELELVEPSLFLRQHVAAARRLATALATMLQ